MLVKLLYARIALNKIILSQWYISGGMGNVFKVAFCEI